LDARTSELELVDRLLGAVRSLIRHEDAAQDAAAFLLEWLRHLRRAMHFAGSTSHAPRGASVPAPGVAGKPPRFRPDSMLRKMARTGIRKISITRRGDGSATVLIDDTAAFGLPRKLATLLDVLASAVEVDDDQFPEFVTYPTLRGTLGIRQSKTGSTSANHAVAQLVHRLRQAFEKAGLNPLLIDSDRKRGVRLLMRRPNESSPGASANDDASRVTTGQRKHTEHAQLAFERRGS
jgi:hypothetical protein